MVSTMTDLLSMSQSDLDQLFSSAEAGSVPDGDMDGIAVFAGVPPLTAFIARFVTAVGWRGKVFDLSTGTLVNKLVPFNMHAVRARVYWQAGWMDGRESIVLDYSTTSYVARFVRDEIREVASGVYLGQVYVGRRRVCNFALEHAEATTSEQGSQLSSRRRFRKPGSHRMISK